MYHVLAQHRVADPLARSDQLQSLAAVYHEVMVVARLGVRGRSQCCNLYRHSWCYHGMVSEMSIWYCF